MDRGEKKECVASLADVFKTTSVVVVAHYSGLTVAQMQALRKQMRAAGASVQVAKNRLVKIAVQGTEVASISELMRGPTLIAYSDDPVAAPKAAVAFAKENDKLVILGGAMGSDLAQRGCCSLACNAAVLGRTAWQTRWHHRGTGDETGATHNGAGREACTRVCGLWRKRCRLKSSS